VAKKQAPDFGTIAASQRFPTSMYGTRNAAHCCGGYVPRRRIQPAASRSSPADMSRSACGFGPR